MGRWLVVSLTVLTAACAAPGPDESGTSDSGDLGNQSAAAYEACIESRQDVLRTLQNMVLERNSGCTQDADCTTLEVGISCQQGCSGALPRSRLAEAQAAMGSYAAQVCPTLSTDCGVSGSCAPPAKLVCDAGACRMVFGSGG